MEKELTKKAAKMLLNGATLLSEPCPYCTGVRVMKEGHALCISCGREPEKKDIRVEKSLDSTTPPLKKALQKKMETLSKELENENDHQKQQNILKTINSLLETIEKIKDKQ
ncbi:MAG: autoantigen p27 domain-containing protein [Nitrosopumilus sp.]|nr:autoantigen p27 domain-containing protein [Nitrosopumilus sp.]MDH3854323.1 autoantigen p27 domain-containing protein [Nitrosopumilus sp.]